MESASGGPSAVPGKPAQRLADGVYSTMLNQLITQEIKPDERITVDGVSRAMGVSQTPVREALTRLEADGLVVKIHLVGYRATPQLDRVQFESLYEMRLLVEEQVAAKAARRRTEQQCKAMRAAVANMSRLAAKARASYGEFALEDARLHDLIAASAGNEFLRDALTRLHSHVHLFRLRANARVSAEALEEHEALVEAIATGEPVAARKAMHAHLVRSRDRYRADLR